MVQVLRQVWVQQYYAPDGPVRWRVEEDRITALERKVAMLELLRSQDERKAEEALPPAQARTMKEINENLTILLGVTSSQGGYIKVIKVDMGSIKDRLERLEAQSREHTALLAQILARLPEKP